MTNDVEIELLQERIDSLRIANEQLRERLIDATKGLGHANEVIDALWKVNRQLNARLDRLQLHLSQGIEL